MCLRLKKICSHQRVCVLSFLKNSQIRCTLLPILHSIIMFGSIFQLRVDSVEKKGMQVRGLDAEIG
jgi:hypothetical protein